MTSDALVLGPLIRHVDTTTASIWVETRDPARVAVRACGRAWRARTFAVHGHHYALVEIDGLAPGTAAPYTVEVDDEEVWPPADSEFPPSRIATLDPDKPLRMAFGSCRTSVPHDAEGNRSHGVDALRAYALKLARDQDGAGNWPDLVLFLGDQVYADETTDEMREFIESRRDINQAPWEELKDFDEYAHLYTLAWAEPTNRWLLSTLPSSMIFDDHDIRDDWNTSASWRADIESTSWWHERIVAGMSSYWVYQHLGNLAPDERADDEIWQQIRNVADDAEDLDLTDTLDAFAARVDKQPDSYRWSYVRDIGHSRLVVVDSRAARVLEKGRRSILDDHEMSWLDDQLQGGFEHLFVGTSLPFLLSPGLHHFEAWSEALVAGSWGTRGARLGERLRQAVDLEHWAAFQDGFQDVASMVVDVADGNRGPAPGTITFLSGDVHHSYVAEVKRRSGSRIVQAVCSPIRNPLPRSMRFATAALAYGVAGPLGRMTAKSANVQSPPFHWRFVEGPWYDNNLATLEETQTCLRMWWETGVVRDGREDRPSLERVASVDLEPGKRFTPATKWKARLSRVRAGRSPRAR